VHIQFAPLFADPSTGAALELHINERQADRVISGELRSPTTSYPIMRGVPRFVEPGNYSGSFGYQWNRWPRLQFDSENVGQPMQGHTGRMFESITGASRLDGQLLLDLGCGPGRFVEIARQKGAQVIAIDYSAAVEAAAQNFAGDPEVCVCQADALALPLRAASVDGVYSIGVLHHTPDPARGVAQAARVTRPEGWIALSVYGKGGYYDFPSVQFWRRVFQRLWPVAGPNPALAYSYATAYGLRPLAHIPGIGPALGKVARLMFPFVPLPDVRWSILDTFDSVTPSYQSAHTPCEVFEWLRSAGLVDIQPSPWGIAASRARKPVREFALHA
jgi:SAM-dependent methyltransferase